jgi:beta-lactamase class A
VSRQNRHREERGDVATSWRTLQYIMTGDRCSIAILDDYQQVAKRSADWSSLPPGTRVAHKTGSITAVLHDAAIVYPQGRTPYVLVVLTKNIPDERVARVLIADLSRLVYQHVAQPAS